MMRGSSIDGLSEREGDRTRGRARGSDQGVNGDGDRESSTTTAMDLARAAANDDGNGGSSDDGILKLYVYLCIYI